MYFSPLIQTPKHEYDNYTILMYSTSNDGPKIMCVRHRRLDPTLYLPGSWFGCRLHGRYAVLLRQFEPDVCRMSHAEAVLMHADDILEKSPEIASPLRSNEAICTATAYTSVCLPKPGILIGAHCVLEDGKVEFTASSTEAPADGFCRSWWPNERI